MIQKDDEEKNTPSTRAKAISLRLQKACYYPQSIYEPTAAFIATTGSSRDFSEQVEYAPHDLE